MVLWGPASSPLSNQALSRSASLDISTVTIPSRMARLASQPKRIWIVVWLTVLAVRVPTVSPVILMNRMSRWNHELI